LTANQALRQVRGVNSMSDHYFNPVVAKLLGLPEAVFLHNIRFWTLTNLANKKHIIDRLCWTYNTLDSFSVIFEYWTPRQIDHLISKLVSSGNLIKGNYNSVKYNRTGWYALLPKSYAFYPELCRTDFYQLLFNSPISTPKPASQAISQICEMDFTNFVNGFPKFVKCTTTDNKPDNKPFREKTFRSSNDKKIENQKPKSGFASVEHQSNSYNPEAMNIVVPVSSLLENFMKKKEANND
jgi:hypothetical protein